jgi:predicted outer membrane repeat protein
MHAIEKALLGALLLFGAVPVFGIATPMVFVVDNLGDSGAGTLRQAVIDANANAGAVDTIVFVDGLAGTIQLTSGAIAITEGVQINGPNARVLSVDSTSRIFTINDPNELGTTIQGLTLTGGVAPLFGNGGGMLVTDARVALFNVTMSDNTAATGEGGAISCTGSGGSLSIEQSTFTRNSAQKGGALHLVLCSIDDMTNSTVSGNTATDSVGGIKLEFVGATIRNSTVAGNMATFSQGGILLNGGNVLNLISSIVADNTDSGGGSDVVRLGGGTINAENSLIETPPAPNTINGTDVANLIGVGPQLQPLANNGGQTDTHALPGTSPAIDRGSNEANLQTDQRGGSFVRTIGGGTDIGAFERQGRSRAPLVAPLGLAALAALLFAFGLRKMGR